MAKKEENEVVKPLVLRVKNDNGGEDVYALEFDRESVRFAESRGFTTDDLGKYPMTKIPELFYYAFRKNHKNISREKTDKIIFDAEKGWGGIGNIPDGVLERLGQLYGAPFNAMTEAPKNSRVTVEL